jgi:hypothetical protein
MRSSPPVAASRHSFSFGPAETVASIGWRIGLRRALTSPVLGSMALIGGSLGIGAPQAMASRANRSVGQLTDR